MRLAEGKPGPARQSIRSWHDWARSTAKNSGIFDIVYALGTGFADLQETRLIEARESLRQIQEGLPAVEPFYRRVLSYQAALFEGEILLAEGSPGKAAALLEKTPGIGTPPNMQGMMGIYNLQVRKDVLARAYAAAGQPDRAITEYERLTAFDPGRPERDLRDPLDHFRLARLYDERGSREEAAAAYRRFLDLWKNADPELPEPAEARRRSAALDR
jgi:tetratricopeptide (TPR) repeat protein